MEQEKKQGGKKWLAVLGTYKYVLIVIAAGILCLAWPSASREEEAERAAEGQVDAGALQAEMEEILGAIQGVGELRLMLTVDTGPQRELAGDTSLSYSGSTQAPEDYSRTAETVVVSGGGENGVVVTEERCPQYRGALVVCEGGGSDAVRLRVTEAVAALTGLGADRIAVAQGGGTGTN